MSQAVELFLRTLTVTSSESMILDEVESILRSPEELFQYIKRDFYPLTTGQYSGVSANGTFFELSLTIPNVLSRPPSFHIFWWLLWTNF